MPKTTGRYVFPWKGRRIALVAHPDADARNHLKEALSRAGYLSVVCPDPLALLDRRVTAGRAFAILQNAASSLETLRTLRNQGDPIPVILLASADQPSEPDRATRNVGHLASPFTLETLRLAIAAVDHFDPEAPSSGNRRP